MRFRFLSILFFAINAFGDIPPQPEDPVEACKNKKEGSFCETYSFLGNCKVVQSVLTCVSVKETPTTNSAPIPPLKKDDSGNDAKEVGNPIANTAQPEKVQESEKAQKPETATGAGCSSMQSAGTLSVFILTLTALLLVYRRKKAL